MSQAGTSNTALVPPAVLETLTGNSGGAVPPTANNINTLGTGSITIVGSPGTSTLTTQLTGLTNHNVLVGAGTATISKVAPSATSGVPLISQGAAADPVFGTAVVAGGGTGAVTLTSHGVLLGNGTSPVTATAAGTTGQVLTGVTGSAPTFQSPAASSISITGDSGGALTGNAFTFTGGTTGLAFAGAGTTETLGGTLAIANGGTNATSMSTSTGIVKYDGTRLVTSTTATLSAANVQTNTAQPAFGVYLSANQTSVTGDGTAVTIAFNTASYDQASNFNTGTNTFTAPVTGIYLLNAQAFMTGLVAGNVQAILEIVVNGVSYFNENDVFGATSGNQVITNSIMVKMTATNTSTVKLTVTGNATKNATIAGTVGFSGFQGILLC